MNRNPLTTLIIFQLLCLFTLNTLSQEFKIETSKISVLNESIITDVEQDIDGFIWIASNQSIYKYNNKDFINFSQKELLLKPHHSTINLVSDANGNIWYFPQNEFSLKILNTKNNKASSIKDFFPNLPFSESEIINIIYRDHLYNIYISVKNKGLYKFDGKKIEVVKSIKEKNKLPIYFVSTITHNWFGYDKKIIKQNKETLLEDTFSANSEILGANIFNNEAIFFTQKDIRSDNIFAEHIKDNKAVNIFQTFKLNSAYHFKKDRIFQNINNDKYWINEKEYLKQIDKDKKIIFQIKKADLPFGDRYRAFFVDRNNIIWIITQTSLYKIIMHENNFKKYLDGYSLKSIFKRDSTFYISAFSSSLKELDSKNTIHQSKHLTKQYSFFGTFYHKDTLWAARYSRILRYNFKTKTTTDYKRGSKVDNEEVGYGAIARHPKTKTFFIGSLTYLAKIDEAKKTAIAVNSLDKYLDKKDRDKLNVRCFKVYGDSLWIGTAKGVFLMDHKEQISKAFTAKNGFPKNLTIQYIFIENDATFWLATQGQGLVKWNRLTNTFKTFTTKDGLSNNNIYAIYKDKFGFLWLPTDNGLNRFAPKTLKNHIFLPNTISHKEFNHLSHFQDKNGDLYLGGLNGLNVFNPEDFLTIDNTKYNVVLNHIKTTLSNNSVIEKHQINNNTITLNSEVKNTALEFLLLDFKNNLPLQYQYKITPFQKDYVVCENNIVVLPKLKKGKYLLHVKAQSSDGTWAELKTPIQINNNISGDYLNILIILLCATSAIVLFFIIKRKKTKKKELNNKEKSVQKEKTEITESDSLSKIKQEEWLNQLKQTILKNMNSINFGMEFLSQEMELSERQLQRRIKNLTDLTPNKYITEIKLNEAFRLIEEKEVETVKELSIKVGYTTPDYFSKLFKNKFGKKPSDYF
ncbi:AraC-type DNA-binding protein [Polaribacter sp. KT25b]|uniref:helix-turn-helix domain-containing protein n=1 Tax=Polaribacter sp. KT25b TaxID=1855336 RepID=UPI00087BC954|nr:helix-turn-helix domain-containing protein [Polaribacter sp. KT25b]SDS33006.1 AraC-type DNA-binding protein [Polaribacter sp. KT25b]